MRGRGTPSPLPPTPLSYFHISSLLHPIQFPSITHTLTPSTPISSNHPYYHLLHLLPSLTLFILYYPLIHSITPNHPLCHLSPSITPTTLYYPSSPPNTIYYPLIALIDLALIDIIPLLAYFTPNTLYCPIHCVQI